MRSSLLLPQQRQSSINADSLLVFRLDKKCGRGHIEESDTCHTGKAGPKTLDDDKKIEDRILEDAKAQLSKWGVKKPSKQQLETAKSIVSNPSYRRRDAKDEKDGKKKKNRRAAKIAKVMREFKDGKLKSSSGAVVTDRRQALAIALSESSQRSSAN